jgi:prepilin-type N-terminal cleavage/methylation domain-containing protein
MNDGNRKVFGLKQVCTVGFTLIELLTVIAIIAILAAILIPTASGARMSANRARTRVLFAQWAGAIESFRDEYGCYPVFAPGNKINAGATSGPDGLHPFHDVLAGRRRDGSALPAAPAGLPGNPPPPESKNHRRIRFFTFTAHELFPDTRDGDTRSNLLHDAFENPDSAVLVDGTLDGIITAADYPELPAVSPPDDGSRQLTPTEADFPTGPSGGVRAGVLFYCCPPRATDASQMILSWK